MYYDDDDMWRVSDTESDYDNGYCHGYDTGYDTGYSDGHWQGYQDALSAGVFRLMISALKRYVASALKRARRPRPLPFRVDSVDDIPF